MIYNLIQKSIVWKVDFGFIFCNMIHRLDTFMLEQVTVTISVIWFRRNKFIFENSFTHPQSVVIQAHHCLSDFHEVYPHFDAVSPISCASIVECIPPLSS